MRAIRCAGAGGVEVLTYVEDEPAPVEEVDHALLVGLAEGGVEAEAASWVLVGRPQQPQGFAARLRGEGLDGREEAPERILAGLALDQAQVEALPVALTTAHGGSLPRFEGRSRKVLQSPHPQADRSGVQRAGS